jgi:hypothetical protein
VFAWTSSGASLSTVSGSSHVLTGLQADHHCRRCFRIRCPVSGADTACAADGIDKDAIHPYQGLSLDNRHDGYCGFVDLFCTRGGGCHVGQQDQSAHTCSRFLVLVYGYSVWSGESTVGQV